MRRIPHGPITERFEPEMLIIIPALEPKSDWTYGTHNRPWLREALYNHFQIEKYRRKFCSSLFSWSILAYN
jgi:hypothetical protein